MSLQIAPTSGPIDLSSEVLFQSQARFLGVADTEIREAELSRGRALHPEVSEGQIDLIAATYQAAQRAFLSELALREGREPVKIFCAPTGRTLDLLIDQDAPGILMKRIFAEGNGARLIEAIDKGPGSGAEQGSVIWDKPQNDVELVASILRWGAINGAEKKRIRVSEELRAWVKETLLSENITPRERLGGAVAIATVLAPVLRREATMMSLGELPPQLLRHISPHTAVVSEDRNVKTISQLPREESFVGNFCIGFKSVSLNIPLGLGELKVNGKEFDPSRVTQMEIFITGSSQKTGFDGVTLDRMREIGASHPISILSGMQYLSNEGEIQDYFDHLEALHDSGSGTALLYSETKHSEIEIKMWSEIQSRRCIDFLGMNSTEAHDILKRVYSDGLKQNTLNIPSQLLTRIARALEIGESDGGAWESGKEAPEWVFEGARCLQEALKIPLLRVRGKIVDVLVADPELQSLSPEHLRASLIVSRNMGTLKVANPSGILDKPEELEALKNIPHGYHLAGVQFLRDYLLGQGETGAETLDLDCYFRDNSGRSVFVVPPIPFFSRRGETVSAGDTIDSTFASEEGLRSIAEARELNLSRLTKLREAA